MEDEQDTKNGKPILIIIGIALLALFNGVISQTDVKSFRAPFQTPIVASAAAALDPRSYRNLTMDYNETCIPQPNSPLSRVHYVISGRIEDTTHFKNITTSTTEAICMYDQTQQGHFPHAMEQLYGCFAFWNAHQAKKPVLEVEHKAHKKLMRQTFTRGFLHMLQSQISLQISQIYNLTILEARQNSATEKPYMVKNLGYSVIKPYKELNKHAAAHFQLNDTSSDACTHSKPRIGILNRANSSGRSILNAEQIATVAKSLSRDNHIPVVSFDYMDFPDQVRFFRSVDILISPHGAQLTGLAYMDAPCAHLLEFFPKGYGIPCYFGALATTTGKRHSYVYMSNGTFLEEQAKDIWERKSFRNANLCPAIPTIIGYLQELVEDWKMCCASMPTVATAI